MRLPEWDPPPSLGASDLLAWGGIATGLVAASSRTMIPLRVGALASNVLFLAFALAERDWMDALTNLALAVVGGHRLRQMLALVRRAREAARGDFSLDWLKPFMTSTRLGAGEALFAKGDAADAAHFLVRGRLRVAGAGVELPERALVGEMALFVDDKRRTATVEAVEDCELLTIGYAELQELCAQNPGFALYLLKTVAGRLQSRNEALAAGL